MLCFFRFVQFTTALQYFFIVSFLVFFPSSICSLERFNRLPMLNAMQSDHSCLSLLKDFRFLLLK